MSDSMNTTTKNLQWAMDLLREAAHSGKPFDTVGELRPKTREIEDELEGALNRYVNVGDIPVEELLNYAQVLAGLLVAIGLRTSQVRKFLDAMRRLENDLLKKQRPQLAREMLMLVKVQLAYAAGRNRNVKPLFAVVGKLIEKVRPGIDEGRQDFWKILKFVEAVIAYHKFYGGQD